MRALELKIPPVVLCLLLGAAMGVSTALVPAADFDLPARQFVAVAMAVTGLVIAALGVVTFRRAGTTLSPLHPEATAHLVCSGIYRHTRNPIYLGLLLLLLGAGVLLANALALVLAVAFVPLMNGLQIGPEERILAARFGTEFAAYRSTVRRWL